MRRNYLKSMFQASLLAFFVLSSSSCSQEFLGLATDADKGTEVFINVSMDETRTVNEGMQTSWAKGDELSLLVLPLGGTGYTNYQYEYYVSEAGNRFRGRITQHDDINSYYALYPYNEKLSTPKNVEIDVNKTPVQVGNNSTAHLAGSDFPLFGKHLRVPWGNEIKISMENLLSVARFVVTNNASSSIVVKNIEFTSSQYITGPFNADLTSDEPDWESKSDSSPKVTLTVTNGEQIASGSSAEFYIGILPHDLSAGDKLKVKITATVGSKDVVFYRLIELTKGTSFLSGYRKEISCPFDTEHTEDPWPDSENQDPQDLEKYYYKVSSTPSSWDGTYLIVDEDNSVAFAETGVNYQVQVEIVDNKIVNKPALSTHMMTFTSAGSGKYDIQTTQKNYLYSFGSEILFSSKVANNNTYYNTVSISNGKVTLSSTYGMSQKRFCYTGNRFNYVNDESSLFSNASVALYKLGKSQDEEDPNKDTQVISFSSDVCNVTLGEDCEIGQTINPLSLSGAKTDVTYSSSNTNVAEIVNNKIQINAAGTTEITATAQSSDKYNSAVATYTLNINTSGSSSESYFVKVTSEPSSWAGTYLVVDDSAKKAFAYNSSSSYATSVTINSGKIAWTSDLDEIALRISDAGLDHPNTQMASDINYSGDLRAYNVKTKDGKYIYSSQSEIQVEDSNESSSSSSGSAYYHAFYYTDGGVYMFSSKDYTSSSYMKYYYTLAYSSSKFAYGQGEDELAKCQLYKLSGGQSGKQDQSISFAKSAVSWTIGNGCEIDGEYAIQSISGTYYTSVSYSSSKTSVATIENGKIVVKGTGTTTITATAASSSTYNSATAEYTLTIKPKGSSTVSGYELLTAAPSDWSGSYLLVNTDKSYLFNGETSTSNKVSLSSSDFNGNVITNTSYSQYAFTISKSGDNYYFKKGSNYYTVNYSSNSSTGIVTTTSSSDAGWTYKGIYSSTGGFLFSHVKSSSDSELQYIYYNTSDSRFKFGKSGSTTGILLYKLNDGESFNDDDPEEPDDPQDGDYFVKVTSNPSSWTGTYLVVDESAKKAFAYNSSSSYATSVSISSDKIAWTSDLDAIALRVSDAGLNHPNTQMASDISYSGSLRAYNVKTKAGKYIYSSQSEIQVEDSNESSSSSSNGSAYYHAFYYTNGGVYMFSSKDYTSSSYMKYYYTLAYSGSKFAYGQGEDELAKVQLYKLNGESGGTSTEDPTPSGTSFNLENSTLTSYLDDVATSYTNSNYSKTVVKSYTGSSAKLDIPNPVSLSWTGSATSIDIYEGTSTSGTAVKSQTFSSSTTADIYNLIPGKTYSYKTSNGQTGTFKTTGRRRMIKVSDSASSSHARNCRDLGGIETAKGQTLKYGLIFRGTNMDGITTSEKAILRDELGIKLDVDLRGESSVSPLGSDISVSNQYYTSGQMTTTSSNTKLKTTIPDIINSVIDGKPVYIHCAIGSDRTGYVCMLIEALLGASKKECDIDYEITSFASGIVGGTRTKEYTDNQDFREKFVQGSYTADDVPEAVQDYVVNTLGVSLDKVKAFRKAMGVSETL